MNDDLQEGLGCAAMILAVFLGLAAFLWAVRD
jgi:hypothetical protein